MPVLGQIWPFLGPKSNFWGQGVKILVPSYRDSNETPFSCWKHWSVGLKLAARGENVLFWPQNLDIWGQKSIFCLVIAIFVDGTNDHYTRGYNFPIGTTPKKFSVSELGVIFWGSPLFLAVFGHSHFRGATTLNFGPISTKLGGTVRAIKKMTQKDNGPGLGRNYGKRARGLDNLVKIGMNFVYSDPIWHLIGNTPEQKIIVIRSNPNRFM